MDTKNNTFKVKEVVHNVCQVKSVSMVKMTEGSKRLFADRRNSMNSIISNLLDYQLEVQKQNQ
jgi:hypothetical protein